MWFYLKIQPNGVFGQLRHSRVVIYPVAGMNWVEDKFLLTWEMPKNLMENRFETKKYLQAKKTRRLSR